MTVVKRLVALTIAIVAPASGSSRAGTLTTLYTFTGSGGVGVPVGPLAYHGGILYGTTRGAVENGNGDVFQIDSTTGDFKVLHAFQSGSDGAYPYNGVIYHNGLLYGTTFAGGGAGCTQNETKGCGTIFSLNTKTGAVTVLYEFSQDPKSSFYSPGQLAYQNGILYGSTEYGGANGAGSFFSLNLTSGSFATLYSFGGANGINPNPPLLYENGLFYGTTLYGGTGCLGFHGCGTVFSINASTGAENIVHAFSPKAVDGAIPSSNLIYRAGSLMGDTEIGGNKACKRGCGVSYIINVKTGHETVQEYFDNGDQGYSAQTLVGGSDYETLPSGSGGNGELIQVDQKTGQQTVLYTFTGGADGSGPVAPLTYNKGAFYGSTDGGYGTIFKFVP